VWELRIKNFELVMKSKKYPEKEPSGEKVSEPIDTSYGLAADLGIPEFLKPYKEEISDLCKKHQVERLYVFGSVLTDDFKPDSDIDFLIDFNENDPIIYTDLYFGFIFNLEKTLGRKIDLVELRAIKNPYFKKEVDEKKVLIYG